MNMNIALINNVVINSDNLNYIQIIPDSYYNTDYDDDVCEQEEECYNIVAFFNDKDTVVLYESESEEECKKQLASMYLKIKG